LNLLFLLLLLLMLLLLCLRCTTGCWLTDVANVIGKTLEVDSSILTAVMFTQYGMTIAWRLQGSTANELSYTVSFHQTGRGREGRGFGVGCGSRGLLGECGKTIA
jgi:hypothetical protein